MFYQTLECLSNTVYDGGTYGQQLNGVWDREYYWVKWKKGQCKPFIDEEQQPKGSSNKYDFLNSTADDNVKSKGT